MWSFRWSEVPAEHSIRDVHWATLSKRQGIPYPHENKMKNYFILYKFPKTSILYIFYLYPQTKTFKFYFFRERNVFIKNKCIPLLRNMNLEKYKLEQGMIACAYILYHSGGWDRRIKIWGHPRQHRRTPSQKKNTN